MVSANDAAYAIAETVGGSLDGFAADLDRDRQALRHARQHVRRPGRPRPTSTSYKGGPKMSAYDLAIATRNALTVPAIAQWADTHDYDVHRPVGRAPHARPTTTSSCPATASATRAPTASRPATPSRAQHTLVATATRNGRTLHRGDPRRRPTAATRGPRRCSTPGFATPPVAHGHRRDAPAGRGLAVRRPRRRPDRVRQARRPATRRRGADHDRRSRCPRSDPGARLAAARRRRRRRSAPHRDRRRTTASTTRAGLLCARATSSIVLILLARASRSRCAGAR